MQLSIVRKDCSQSGQEELVTESVTVTVKEGADEPAPTKPGMHNKNEEADFVCFTLKHLLEGLR